MAYQQYSNNKADAVPDWFNSSGYQPLQSPKSSNNIPHIILFLLTIIVIIASVVLFIFSYTKQASGIACLNEATYTQLSGGLTSNDITLKHADLKPGTIFFTQAIYFNDESATYSSEQDTNLDQLFATLGDFSVAAQPGKPIQIIVSSDYFAAESNKKARGRLDTIKESLLRTGVPEATIDVSAPKPVIAEDDYITGVIPATISVKAQAVCS